MFIAAWCGAAAWTAGSAGIMVIEQFIRYVELAVGLMVFEYIIRYRPRRRPSYPLAEGFSPTASPA